MNKVITFLGAVVLAVLICVGVVFIGWGNTWFSNQVGYVNQKIDDATTITPARMSRTVAEP